MSRMSMLNISGAGHSTGSHANLGITNLDEYSLQNNQICVEVQFLLNSYSLYLSSSNLSQSTIRYYIRDAKQFLEWIDFPLDPERMGREIAGSYTEHLVHSAHQLRSNSFGEYSSTTINRKLQSLRRFFDHLVDECIFPFNPFREFVAQIPQQASTSQRIPILSVETIRELISTCDLSHPIGIRDRALLICILGFGLRVGEIRLLDTSDVNLIDGALKVTERNKQTRTAPLLDEFACSLELWLVVRSLHSNSSDALFVSLLHSAGRGEAGTRLSKRGLRSIVDRRLEIIGAKKPGVSCDVLRRSAIVHLLKNGAAWDNIRSTFGLNPRTLRTYKDYVSEIC